MEDTRRERPPEQTLEPRAVALMHRLADEFGEKYINELVYQPIQRVARIGSVDSGAIRIALEDPATCLKVFLGIYAFARRGKDRDDLSNSAVTSVNRLFQSAEVNNILSRPDGTDLWRIFEEVSLAKGKKPHEAQNRGMIQGLLELVQEIYADDGRGSLALWIAGAAEDGAVEDEFNRIVDIRGVGPKGTSTFIRDIVQIYDLEAKVEPSNRIYFQPVDRWLRAIAKLIVPEENMGEAADWIVAGKVSKYTRRAGVSGIRFSMGTTYFGQRMVRIPERFEEEVWQLVSTDQTSRPSLH